MSGMASESWLIHALFRGPHRYGLTLTYNDCKQTDQTTENKNTERPDPTPRPRQHRGQRRGLHDLSISPSPFLILRFRGRRENARLRARRAGQEGVGGLRGWAASNRRFRGGCEVTRTLYVIYARRQARAGSGSASPHRCTGGRKGGEREERVTTVENRLSPTLKVRLVAAFAFCRRL